jgi:hypothetical protein
MGFFWNVEALNSLSMFNPYPGRVWGLFDWTLFLEPEWNQTSPLWVDMSRSQDKGFRPQMLQGLQGHQARLWPFCTQTSSPEGGKHLWPYCIDLKCCALLTKGGTQGKSSVDTGTPMSWIRRWGRKAHGCLDLRTRVAQPNSCVHSSFYWVRIVLQSVTPSWWQSFLSKILSNK